MSDQLHIIILSQWNILHLQTVGCKQRRVLLSWFICRHFANYIRLTASSNGDRHMWRLSSVSSLLNTQCFDSWLYSRYQTKYKNYATLRSVPIPHNGHPLAAHIHRKCCINLRNIKKNIFIFVIYLTMLFRTRYIGQYAIRSERPENLGSITGGNRNVSFPWLWAPSSLLFNRYSGTFLGG
jgi:hypothetical protein